MAGGKRRAVAYYRTSSASNVGADKDSEVRQREAVATYARSQRIDVVEGFYDAAVSGADPIDVRPGFVALLDFCQAHAVDLILVENASRFARDLIVQLTGHELLKGRGVELVPVDAPDHFTDETPTAKLIRSVLGAVSEFEKAALVSKLRHARDRKRAATGRCEGRPPVPVEVVAEARRLARKPAKGKRRTLREIGAELAGAGMMSPSGRPYLPGSVALMLKERRATPAKVG